MGSLRGGPPAPPGRASARNHPTDPQGRPLAASPRCHGRPGKKAASEGGARDGAGPARAAARSGREAATVAIRDSGGDGGSARTSERAGGRRVCALRCSARRDNEPGREWRARRRDGPHVSVGERSGVRKLSGSVVVFLVSFFIPRRTSFHFSF